MIAATITRKFSVQKRIINFIEKNCRRHAKNRGDLHAHMLMTNHAHFLVAPNSENSLAKATQMLGRYHVQYYALDAR